jgi:hypothetical protein
MRRMNIVDSKRPRSAFLRRVFADVQSGREVVTYQVVENLTEHFVTHGADLVA